ncbi:hypothetical protein GJ496_009534 [Pomphorhynchus laevis]|nr:hypothetical protein GJ496_009534 [Pomphorhynchus laevis]
MSTGGNDSLLQYLTDNENRDGIRLTFNVWPSTRIDSSKLVVPLAALYTPFKCKSELPTLNYEPVRCTRSNCKAILNPFSHVDYKTKMWTCVFCLQRNTLPSSYHGMDEQNRVAELYPRFTTIEYTLPSVPQVPINFLFVIDICLTIEEMTSLLETIKGSLQIIPRNANIGLITFGRIIQIHVLNPESMSVSYVFKGAVDVPIAKLKDWLMLHSRSIQGNAKQGQMNQGPQQSPHASNNRFLLPISQYEKQISEIISQVRNDPWPLFQGKRARRSTGTALSIAVSLLETLFPNCAARILTFIGGPCTEGPGMVVDEELKNPIRSHHDIQKDEVKYMRKAIKFYESLANRSARNGFAMDLFSCCLDQTGLAEMKYCCNYTGGVMVMGDSFQSTLFKDSFMKIFTKLDITNKYDMAFNANIEVKTSRELKLCGCIGLCTSLNENKGNVSDQEIGIGGTSVWKSCLLTSLTTHAFFFDLVTTQIHADGNNQGYMQIITKYTDSDGVTKIRVTTISRRFMDSSTIGIQSISAGFDQDASAVIMARIAVFRCEIEETTPPDVLRWIDKTLIRVCQKFGMYSKDNPSSFHLQGNFFMYPQYMFHLRRSQFLQVFNNSPDETSYYRGSVNEDTMHRCNAFTDDLITTSQKELLSLGHSFNPSSRLFI